ncbi:hypothetical protein AA313_de0207360 [Arthrobotrys entomopaga]|nr:hypothetical protein AA313_de0207360 [Arthrobotrys entomopaga]
MELEYEQDPATHTSPPSPSASAASASSIDPNALTPLINLPQEILIHIVKLLPVVLDVFYLRQTCKSLYHRLGPANQPLWHHFINHKKGRRRFAHYIQDIDYFSTAKKILRGEADGCQICLKDARYNYFNAYRGGIFYKSVCRNCAVENFTELWRLEDQYPGLKIHPNNRITWVNGFPFDDPISVTGRYTVVDYNRNSVRNVDLQIAIKEQMKPVDDTRNLAKEAWESRYDKQITFAHKRKESADIIVGIMAEEYRTNYTQLHWLMPPERFPEYLYNSLLWNLRPWLAPHYCGRPMPNIRFGHYMGVASSGKAMPRFTLGDNIDELMDFYSDSEELLPDLRWKGLQDACRTILQRELAKIPQVGQNIRKANAASSLIRYWLDAWLRERGHKGVPRDGTKDFRNTARKCPFCEPTAPSLNCTQALAVHVWCRHTDQLEEEWAWIDGS